MRVLITGMTGFIGKHLAPYLVERGCDVYGTILEHDESASCGAWSDRVNWTTCDVCDPPAVTDLVARVCPDVVFHLVGHTGGRSDISGTTGVFGTNVLGSLHVLEALRCAPCNPVLVIPVSSAVFGASESALPIDETTAYGPVNPYGVAKAAQALLAKAYAATYQMKVLGLHTFNCIGPGQCESFVCSILAKQIVEMELGLREPTLDVGDLDTWRDFVDVRDVARAYWLAVTKGRPGEKYTICSGSARSVRQILEQYLLLTHVSIKVVSDPTRFGRSGIPFQVGSFQRFHARTGWTPIVPLKTTLQDMLDDWRDRLAAQGRRRGAQSVPHRKRKPARELAR